MFEERAKEVVVAKLPLKMNLQLFAEEVAEEAASFAEEPSEPSEQANSEETEVIERTDTSEEAAEPPAEEPKRDFEKDSAYAELRRQKEALEKQNQFARKYGKYGVFEESDIAKVFGDRGINSVSDLENAIEADRREKERQEWIEQGQDPELIEKIVDSKLNNHPEVVKGRQAAYENMLVSNFDEVKREFPGLVKDPGDIPEAVWQRFNDGKNGISLADAYTLVNRKAIIEHEQAKVRQAALNNASSKNHMKPTGSDGAGADLTQIPDEVMSQYRRLFKGKGMTDKDFIAHYKKSIGG